MVRENEKKAKFHYSKTKKVDEENTTIKSKIKNHEHALLKQ
jgi:hypothetical protein